MNVEFLHTRLSFRFRFVIAFLFYALAALLQVLMVRGGNFPLTVFRFAGLGLLLIPIWFLKARNFSNKPDVKRNLKPVSSAEIWRPVTMTELDRLRDRLETTRKAKIPRIYSLVFGIVVTFISLFLITFSVAFADVTGIFVLLDLYLIFFPFLWFARIEKWSPAIGGKVAALSPILQAKLPEKIQLLPMLSFSGDGGELVPNDIRIMLAPGVSAPREVREELLGAQFQVVYNKGPNGEVPYVYAVFITKGEGRIWGSLKNVRAAGYVTEPGSSSEGDTVYGTVVLRLDTKSRSDAYHTRENDVQELLNLVVRALEKI